MAALPDSMTVAQFRELPEGGECTYELHYGEVVRLTRPKAWHWNLQRRIVRLLDARLAGFGVTGMEFPYRGVPEYDLRVADVAIIAHDRFESVDPNDNLHGSPELVIEVKSPSNTRSKLGEVVSFCLTAGAREVWIVEPDRKCVAVYPRDHPVAVYGSGSAVPLTSFGGDSLPVDDIFNESSRR